MHGNLKEIFRAKYGFRAVLDRCQPMAIKLGLLQTQRKFWCGTLEYHSTYLIFLGYMNMLSTSLTGKYLT
jgi:hypothetical protein